MNALAKKLLIKPHTSWLFYNAPAGYFNLLEPFPDGLKLCTDAGDSINGIQFFVKSDDELNQQLPVIAPLVKPETIVWITYPKKSSGIATGLSMDGLREKLAAEGLEVVASLAVDQTWSALRLRLIGLSRKSNIGNAEIRQNEYAGYIDVDNKTVILPPDAEQALQAEPRAMAVYQRLAYSHKKEYILWVLTAKQQKTREARLVKMVEMLIGGKKNPGEK